MNKYNYKLYDIVYFDNKDGASGLGEVLGVSSVGIPGVGAMYILRVIEQNEEPVIPSETYPFTHLVCGENNMSLRSRIQE